MTLIELQQKLKERIRTAAQDIFGVEPQQLAAEVPPRPDLGDLAFPVSFELAKLIKQATGEKQNPRAIAEKLKSQLEDIEEVSRVEIAGAGYINVFYDRARLLALFAGPTTGGDAQDADRPKKSADPANLVARCRTPWPSTSSPVAWSTSQKSRTSSSLTSRPSVRSRARMAGSRRSRPASTS